MINDRGPSFSGIEKESILKIIREKVKGPLTMRSLIRLLSIPKVKRDHFKRLVKGMVREGDLVKVRGNRYGLPSKMNLIIGRMEGHPEGFGFVIPEDGGRDVFVNPANMNGAMDGDRVIVRVDRFKREGKREGSIIRILQRSHKEIVGRYDKEDSIGIVTPLDEKIPYDVLIPYRGKALQKRKGSPLPGDIVVTEILEYPRIHRPPIGRIIKILGDLKDPDVEKEIIIRKYGLPLEFDHRVMEEARVIPKEVSEADTQGRIDLRSLNTLTIDGEEAKDFDDAVSIERLESGGYRLYISVADVSHYVREGSPIDEEAYKRGTSVYFPGSVIPMLPEELSNGICSLVPDKDRLAFSVIMEFDSAGRQMGVRFVESLVRSKRRLTYTKVRRILVDEDHELKDRYKDILRDLKDMERLCRLLRKRRMERGSIDFDLPQAYVVLDLRGKVEDIIREERNIAHLIIEEFMLAANKAVAENMLRTKRPFLYRVHEPPEEMELISFRDLVNNMGYSIAFNGVPSPKVLQRILEGVEGRPEERLVNHLLLRSMKQARYLEENRGHYALAFPVYTHFTSPIRRYPDLLAHRLFKANLKGDDKVKWDHWKDRLPVMATYVSQRERVAMEAEREIVNLMKVEFMKDRVGDVFSGVVSGVASFGVFVELEDFPIEGMIHVSSLSDDYYIYDEGRHCLIGENRKRVFRIGDKVKVIVEKVDSIRKRIDFNLFKGS